MKKKKARNTADVGETELGLFTAVGADLVFLKLSVLLNESFGITFLFARHDYFKDHRPMAMERRCILYGCV